MDINQVKAFLTDIGITKDGKLVDNDYVVTFPDSDSWSVAYSLLEESDLVDSDPEAILSSEYSGVIYYLSDNYDLKLEAKYTTDTYTLVVSDGE